MPIYEAFCSVCQKRFEWWSRVSDDTMPCPKCGGVANRLYSLCAVKIFEPFTSPNILPGGQPVTITNQRQLSSLCNEFGLTPLDDPKAEIRHRTPPTPGEILGNPNVMPDRREEASGPARKEDLLS